MSAHRAKVDKFYSERMVWPASALGRILFLGEKIPCPNPNRHNLYVILVWKNWEWLSKLHNYSSGRNKEDQILRGCSVKNCIFTGNDNMIYSADAVLINVQQGVLPVVERDPSQRWIFMSDEPPNSHFLSKNGLVYKNISGVFNWSMTYRADADVPIPYIRTIPLEKPMAVTSLSKISKIIPHWSEKYQDVLVTVLMSNCNDKAQNNFLNILNTHLKVDVYGKCSDNQEFRIRYPQQFKSDHKVISKYLFYLVLEKSHCFHYISEKVFYAYKQGAIPVIWGALDEDVETLLPPNSYLNVYNETDIEQLAMTILYASKNDELLSLHKWRSEFKVVNEHEYFGTKSYYLCRLCEAMNYNDKSEKIYDESDLAWFLDPSVTCKN